MKVCYKTRVKVFATFKKQILLLNISGLNRN